MSSVDSQVKDLHEVWDNEHRTKPRMEVGVSEVDGLPTLRITSPFVEDGTKDPGTELHAGGNAESLQEDEKNIIPDPWDPDTTGDWNDWAIGLHSKYYEKDK